MKSHVDSCFGLTLVSATGENSRLESSLKHL